MSLQGQVALITGASQGIGAAIATHLSALGLDLVLCARQVDKLQALAEQLTQAHGNRILPLNCDVTQAADVERVIQTALETFGKIHVLVNNAGVAPREGLLQEASIADIDRTIDTNLKAVAYFMHGVLPVMIRQRDAVPSENAVIININSIAGQVAYPYWSLYDASKFGLRALTEAVAEEQRTNGIRIVGLYPGAVDTPIWNGIYTDQDPDRARMLSPETVADAVGYILQQPAGAWVKSLTLCPTYPAV